MSLFNKKNDLKTPVTAEPVLRVSPAPKKINSILKGSRLKGDILVTCDLELSGEILGNITARESSSVWIKGSCKGNIETLSGNVQIDGEMIEGNISAGGDVHITGKFLGGSVIAGGKCYIDGEFSGKIEATDIEIGPNAKIKGQLHYREGLSILRGAKVSGALNPLEASPKAETLSPALVVG
ncbi:MAG: polymer-forming cytoskeletal protein [Proteobacteria bacterium]|nr:polymer-forming cytoskeletal protein [Pseudomonadota bacterium]